MLHGISTCPCDKVGENSPLLTTCPWHVHLTHYTILLVRITYLESKNVIGFPRIKVTVYEYRMSMNWTPCIVSWIGRPCCHKHGPFVWLVMRYFPRIFLQFLYYIIILYIFLYYVMSTVNKYSPLGNQGVCWVCLPTTFLDIRARLFFSPLDPSKIGGWQNAWADNQVYSGGNNNCVPRTSCDEVKDIFFLLKYLLWTLL